VTSVQQVGKLLAGGASALFVSKQLRISRETVTAIDELLGFRAARKVMLADAAADAVSEGNGVKKFARQSKIPRSTARRYLRSAKGVPTSSDTAQ
jgi:hypothetical protein